MEEGITAAVNFVYRKIMKNSLDETDEGCKDIWKVQQLTAMRYLKIIW